MTYQIQKTEGIILASRGVGEADKIYSIYSKDFGRLDLAAQGVRYLKSKLRYSLSTFSYIRFAFIRTRESLRLIDVEELADCGEVCENLKKLAVFSKVAKLFERMIRGEESDPFVWQELKNSFIFLKENDLDIKKLNDFELLFSLRLLYHLGYVDEKKELLPLLNGAIFTEPVFKNMERIKPLITSAIENAIAQSHL